MLIDQKTGKEMVISFRLWAVGFRLTTAGKPVPFVGTMAQVFEEMKRSYETAGSPPHSHMVADYWSGCQITYPASRN